MNMICVISARGGSQGVPGKNIRPLLGKPVIVWAIEKALASALFSHVVVSTDSPEIAEVAKAAGASVPFMRPTELAQSCTGKFQVWKHALEACEKNFGEKYNIYVDIDCTNPLIEVQDIIDIVHKYKEIKNKRPIDALFMTSRARHNPYFNLLEYDSNGALKKSKQLPNEVVCRQDAPSVYAHVAGVYVLDAAYIRRADYLLDGHTEGFLIPSTKAHDIDDQNDFDIIEYLLKRRLSEEKKTKECI